MDQRTLRELAREGVQARIAKLQAEIEQLSSLFPGLRADNSQKRTARPKRRLSAAHRAALSKRMRAVWREKRRKVKKA